MEQHLNVLSQALNKANQAGAFNLQESAIIANSLGAIIQVLGTKQSNPIEEARAAAKAQQGNTDSKEKSIAVEVIPQDNVGDAPEEVEKDASEPSKDA